MSVLAGHRDTEDRELFVEKLNENQMSKSSRAKRWGKNLEDPSRRLRIGLSGHYPPPYALGGLGSGFCDNEEQLDVLVEKGLFFFLHQLEKSLPGGGKKSNTKSSATASTTVLQFVIWRTLTLGIPYR